MSVRSVVLAFMLASGVAVAANKHPKPLKVSKHATHTPKTVNHKGEGRKAVVHNNPKVAKRKTTNPKMVKRKTSKFQKHKA